MNIAEIANTTQLREYMTAPTHGVMECVKKVKGDILVLGGSGKMGPELTEMIVRADALAGITRKISVASTFSNPRERTAELFAELGVQVFRGELTDPAQQRARFEKEMAKKERVYGERYPLDEDFLKALENMPPASGVALGFDRLVMLSTGAPNIDDVLWTPLV